MASNFRNFYDGLRIFPKTTSTASLQGEMDVDTTSGKVNYHNGTTSSPVVTESSTATLTNKTLVNPVITGSTGITKADVGLSNVDNTSDATKNAATATLTNKTLTSPVINSPTGITKSDVGLGNVDNTSDATKNAAVATLTNKSIDATTNTLTNISNTSIAASAAIARSKLGTGTANHVVINDGSGNFSSEASLAITRGGTGAATATAGFDALAPTTTKGDIIVRTSSSNVRQPIGSDGQVLVGDSTQTNGLKWATLQQGAKNYLTYNNFENNATTGFSLFNTTLTSGNPTGTISAGAASVTTFATTATNPLAGTYSLNTASSAAWSAGQGFITQAYSIDREDLGRVMTFKFFNEVVSGLSNLNVSGTTSNTFAIWVYDVTNSAWVQPSSSYGLTGTGSVQGTFQLPTTCLSFRLAILAANASVGAVSLNFDDFTVGPQVITQGTPFSDLPPMTTTGTWTSGCTYTGKYYREGRFLKGQVSVKMTGGVTAAVLGVNLPGGLSIDTNEQLGTSANNLDLGSAALYRAATGDGYLLAVRYSTPTTFTVATNNAVSVASAPASFIASTGGLNSTSPYTIAINDEIIINYKVPIVGWSSNVQMSSDAATNVVAMSASVPSNGAIASGNSAATGTLLFSTVHTDTNGSYNSATGIYTVAVPGVYDVSSNVVGGATPTAVNNQVEVLITLNGTATSIAYATQYANATTIRTFSLGLSRKIALNAGDTLRVVFLNSLGASWTATGTSGSCNFNVNRISGPSQIAASESVSFMVGSTTSTIPASNVEGKIIFSAVTFDSHNSYSTTTGNYTAPIGGVYEFTTQIVAQGLTPTATDKKLSCYFNRTGSVSGAELGYHGNAIGSTAANQTPTAQTTFTMKLLTGDIVNVNAVQNLVASTALIVNNSAYVFFSGKRTGN